MAFYQYVVLNQENKKLTGTIVAGDETLARQELNNLGFSTVSLQEITESEYHKIKAGKQKFEFEALNKQGKKVIGTIPANDKYQAYKKLTREYLFSVSALIESGLPEGKKAGEKTRDIEILKTRLEQEILSQTAQTTEKTEDAKADKHDEEILEESPEYQAMKQKAEIVLSKVNEVLSKFEGQIVPEKAKEIRNIVNKLIRIKSSSNMRFIEKTCEELLQKIQDQELFITSSQISAERQKVNIESRRLMIELHKKSPDKGSEGSTLVAGIKNFLQKLGLQEGFLNEILEKFKTPEEIKLLKTNKKILNEQIITYLKLWLRAAKEEKKEIISIIKSLLAQRQKIRKEIKIKLKELTKEEQFKKSFINSIYQEISNFSAWLLFFYLILYFLANYYNSKQIDFIPSYFLQFYQLPFLQYSLLVIFTVHVFASAKITWFSRSILAGLLMLPLAIFLSFILVINFNA